MDSAEDRYGKFVKQLFEKHRSVQTAGFRGDSYKPGLDGIRDLDISLGRPSGKFRSIHVAGTNGKGSVCSMIASNLAAAGFRVGLYTSPHLLDFRERARILTASGFELIPQEKVLSFADRLGGVPEHLSFFEISTALAFDWFASEKVDYAVIEVGLGGRLDSTNIISPELSVITSIGLDHCELLGDTRAAIAREKAGIFKKGVPALVWGHDPETDSVFEEEAHRLGATLHYASGEFSPLLEGPSQTWNIRTVRNALELLGIPFNEEATREMARRTGLRGRWERHGNFILDIAHNAAGLKANMERLSGEDGLNIVYGVMADKNLELIAPLFPPQARMMLVAPRTPRALPVDELLRRLQLMRGDLDLRAFPSVGAALEEADGTGTLTYVGGSTFVVAEALEFFQNN